MWGEDDRPHSWEPPPLPVQAERTRVKGALNGSLLLEQPRHRAEVERLHTFLDRPGPVAVEVGIDHGTVLIDHARARPGWRWVGLEIRRRKVARAAPHAPPNALLWAADARTVFAAVMPEKRIARIDILFPTPVRHSRHLLLTPNFVEDLQRSLAPRGVVTVATDVAGLFDWTCRLFAQWREVEAPWRGPIRSRRERVCLRDGLAVYWGHWTPSEMAPAFMT